MNSDDILSPFMLIQVLMFLLKTAEHGEMHANIKIGARKRFYCHTP